MSNSIHLPEYTINPPPKDKHTGTLFVIGGQSVERWRLDAMAHLYGAETWEHLLLPDLNQAQIEAIHSVITILVNQFTGKSKTNHVE